MLTVVAMLLTVKALLQLCHWIHLHDPHTVATVVTIINIALCVCTVVYTHMCEYEPLACEGPRRMDHLIFEARSL